MVTAHYAEERRALSIHYGFFHPPSPLYISSICSFTHLIPQCTHVSGPGHPWVGWWWCESDEAHVAALVLLSVTQWGSVTSWLAPTAHSSFIPNLDSLSCTHRDKIQNTCNIIRFLHFFMPTRPFFFYCRGKNLNKVKKKEKIGAEQNNHSHTDGTLKIDTNKGSKLKIWACAHLPTKFFINRNRKFSLLVKDI